MNEAETRAEHIDPALARAGWGIVDASRIRREFPITLGRLEGQGRRGKPLTADYVLIYRNTKLAVVEAKAWDEPVSKGVAQAKDYAGRLSIRCAYATNGQGIYGVDMQNGWEGDLTKFPTPDELWSLVFDEENGWRDRFARVPFEDKGGSHPRRPRRQRQGEHHGQLQPQAAGVPRLRAVALRAGRRARARPRQTRTAAEP